MKFLKYIMYRCYFWCQPIAGLAFATSLVQDGSCHLGDLNGFQRFCSLWGETIWLTLGSSKLLGLLTLHSDISA